MNEEQIQYARRVLGNRSFSSLGFGPLTESFGPNQSGHVEAAADALAALKTGTKLKPAQLYQLESIIVRSGRPVFDVRNDSFLDPGPAWPELEAARAFVEIGIRAVGRVNL